MIWIVGPDLGPRLARLITPEAPGKLGPCNHVGKNPFRSTQRFGLALGNSFFSVFTS